MQTLLITDCINVALKPDSNGIIFTGETNTSIAKIAPDLVGYKEILPNNLKLSKQLAMVRFPPPLFLFFVLLACLFSFPPL
jgi:hypothetical protein